VNAASLYEGRSAALIMVDCFVRVVPTSKDGRSTDVWVWTASGSCEKSAANKKSAHRLRALLFLVEATLLVVTMGFTAALIGAATGFSVQMFSNATKKVPLSRGENQRRRC